MATNSSDKPDSDRFQFNLRTLLIVMTAACVWFGFLAAILPKSLPIEIRLIVYFWNALLIAFVTWQIYRWKRRPWQTPVDYVTVKVDAKWKRRVTSPLIMGPIAALTGVSLTFAPLYLLWCGPVEEFGIIEWITVPLCLLIIYIVPGFYMRLASEVMAELHKSESPPGAS